MTVVTIGEAMVLLMPAVEGALESPTCLRVGVAGAESNVAVMLSRLGVATRWLSKVGSDPLGNIVLSLIASEGVDVSNVEADSGGPTGIFLKSRQDSTTQVLYYRNGSAATKMSRSWLKHEWLEGATALVTSGITVSLSAACEDLIDYLVHEACPQSGIPVFFDVNWRLALRPSAVRLAAIASAADLVKASEDELYPVWGSEDRNEILRHLRPNASLVVTGPEQASFHQLGRDPIVSPSVKIDGEIVDASGAGDSFLAGFAWAVLQGKSPMDGLRVGHCCAASALTSWTDHGSTISTVDIDRALNATDDAWGTAVMTPDGLKIETPTPESL